MEASARVLELNRQFGISGIAEVVTGNSGLPMVQITTPAAAGEIYLHGAHVTSWRPNGAEEVFFVSSQSKWEDGKAIRGGVPICFPWFGDKSDDPKAPSHGFVRTKSWQLDSIRESGGAVTVEVSTGSDESTKRWWPADFRAVYRATFGSELRLELKVQNIGTSPLRFEEALHSYHRVGDVNQASLNGLDAVHYLDKTDAYQEKVQQGNIRITAETDRVYLNTQNPIDLTDPVLRRRIHIGKDNSLTTVIWNPWIEKAKAMSDLGDDEWKQMLCVESSNVLSYEVELAPGQQHQITAVIRVGDL